MHVVTVLLCCAIVATIFTWTAGDTLLYANSETGTDAIGCGATDARPCRTIQYTIRAAEHVGDSNDENVTVIVHPGLYDNSSGINLVCPAASKRHFTIVPDETAGKHVVRMDGSLSIQHCRILLVNITWVPSHTGHGTIHTHYFTSVSYIGNTFQGVNVTIISDGSRVTIDTSEFVSCQPVMRDMPILLARSTAVITRGNFLKVIQSKFWFIDGRIVEASDLDTVIFSNVDIAHSTMDNLVANVSNLLAFQNVDHLVLENVLYFRNNQVSILVDHCRQFILERVSFFSNTLNLWKNMLTTVRSNGSIEHCMFAKNTGSGHLIHVGNESGVLIQSSTFHCNDIGGGKGHTCVDVADDSNGVVVDCTMQECPLVCGAGEEARDAVLCRSCSPGYFSPGHCENGTCVPCKRCPKGYYTASRSTEICSPCPAGKFCKREGCVKCEKCKNDFFTSNIGAGSCIQPQVLFTVLVSLMTLLIVVPLSILVCRHVTWCHRCLGLRHWSHRRLSSSTPSSASIQDIH